MNRLSRWFRSWLAWAKVSPALAIALVVISLAVTDVIVLDRWGVKGTVSDAVTGNLIEDAWVLAQFGGEEPLINIPHGPDPLYRTGKCMGGRLVKTDHLGRFRFDSLAFNRPLANKSAHLVVFKPGWLTGTEDSEIASSLWTLSPQVRFELKRGPGERLQVTKPGPGFPTEKLPLYERTRSAELFSTTHLIVKAMSVCDPVGLPMASAAMERALEIAKTYDERERTHAACLYAKSAAVGAKREWPFDCEHLPFKKPVSAEVLAVEAEVAEDRRMRLKKFGDDKSG